MIPTARFAANPYGVAVEAVPRTVIEPFEKVRQSIVIVSYEIAVRFLIEKVAPTSQTLRQEKPRHYGIRHDAEILLLDFSRNHSGKIAQDYAAVDAQAAAAEIEKRGPIGRVGVAPREYVYVSARAEHSQRNYDESVNRYIVRVVAALFEIKPRCNNCHTHTEHYHYCVEIDFQAENGQIRMACIPAQTEFFVSEYENV